MRKTIRMLKDDSGAALMMAIFTITMLMIIATEIMYETSVEFVVSSQTVNQVKAHYAAKAGVQISLLRIFIYRKVMAAVGPQMAAQLPILDMIWKMPFAWPPIVPDSVNRVDKEAIAEKVKLSKMDSRYLATLDSESSKIDLTTLASDNEKLRELTLKQLEQIFLDKKENDDAFARRHSGEDFRKIVANIRDWVDADNKSDQGSDEKTLYSHLGEEGKDLPPNQPFKTFEEIHMVSGITDEFYEMILPKVTIYGAKAINVKYASRDVLKTMFGLTDEQVTRVLTERDKPDTTAFKDASTFYQFLESIGVRKEQFKDPKTGNDLVNILIEPEFNFRIKSTGSSGKISREITAIVFDYDQVLAQLRKFMPTPTPTPPPAQQPGTTTPPTGPTPTPSPSPAATQAPSGEPNIVYWFET